MAPKQRNRRPEAPGAAAVRAAFRGLQQVRARLFIELRELLRDPDYLRGEPAHQSCIRPRNQMRISPLEAEAIAEALRTRPELARRLPAIKRRLRRELRLLVDSTRRQSFSCPLLENGLCLVHSAAKPVGCLAWHPGRGYTDLGWDAFARRDALNDAVHGRRWKLRAIPLWLARVLEHHPGPARAGASGSPPHVPVEGRTTARARRPGRAGPGGRGARARASSSRGSRRS